MNFPINKPVSGEKITDVLRSVEFFIASVVVISIVCFIFLAAV